MCNMEMIEKEKLLAIPWINGLHGEITDISGTNVLNWCGVLSKLGLAEAERNEWIQIFRREVEETFINMTEEVTARQNKIIEDIEWLLKKAEQFCKQLGIKMPLYGLNNINLYEERAILSNKILELEQLIEEKKLQVTALNREQASLCKQLGMTCESIPENPLPSSQVLSDFQTHLEALESEIFNRREEFTTVKCNIVEVATQLGYLPSLDFEKMVLSQDDSLFLVTDNNMMQLNNFFSSLETQLTNTRSEIDSLREKIKALWEVLDECWTKRDEFLRNHTGMNFDTLNALRMELARCEALKKANIEVFVKRLRQELVSYWNKCHVTESARIFDYFNTELYNEDLLTLFDLEIDKFKRFYTENEKLFKLLEQRKDLWEKMVVLEGRAAEPAPDRYKNRGGNLLQEERQRNKLAKEIPQIEQQMLHLADRFEARTKQEFTSWGISVRQIIQESHKKYDNEKKLKLSVRKQQREKTLTPGKSTLALTSTKSTLNLATTSSCKRKQNTPLFPSKRFRLHHNKENVPQSEPPLIRVNDHDVGPSRYSLERAKRIKKSQQRLARNLTKTNLTTSNEDYDIFKREMGSRSDCRSTLFLSASNLGDAPLAVPLPSTPSDKRDVVKPSRDVKGKNSPRSQIASKLTTAPAFQMNC